jgi:hypothetical protein
LGKACVDKHTIQIRFALSLVENCLRPHAQDSIKIRFRLFENCLRPHTQDSIKIRHRLVYNCLRLQDSGHAQILSLRLTSMNWSEAARDSLLVPLCTPKRVVVRLSKRDCAGFTCRYTRRGLWLPISADSHRTAADSTWNLRRLHSLWTKCYRE